jgi:hypothetical protein
MAVALSRTMDACLTRNVGHAGFRRQHQELDY